MRKLLIITLVLCLTFAFASAAGAAEVSAEFPVRDLQAPTRGVQGTPVDEPNLVPRAFCGEIPMGIVRS